MGFGARPTSLDIGLVPEPRTAEQDVMISQQIYQMGVWY